MALSAKIVGSAALIAAGSMQAARAETLQFPPLKAKICVGGIVDKELLAAYLIAKYPVSVLAWGKIAPKNPVSSQRELLAALLATTDVCKNSCAPSDQDHLTSIKGAMLQFLAGSALPAYSPPGSATGPAQYFLGSNAENAVRCASDSVDAPIEAPGARFVKTPASTSQVRVRGKPEQLDVDRNKKQEFAATDKATIDVLDNRATTVKTTKVVGYVGYASLQDDKDGNWTQTIPYVGVNRTFVEVGPNGGSTKPSQSSVVSAGALFMKYMAVEDSRGRTFGHELSARPAFLADNEDRSRQVTLNLVYTPVMNAVLNDFVPFAVGENRLWRKWIFSLRTDLGHYSNRGIESVADKHKDFARIGGQAGVALSCDAWPVDFVATHTSLARAKGESSIDYFKSSLAFSFDANKYSGLTLSYSHGRTQDTVKKENQWEVTLGIRF